MERYHAIVRIENIRKELREGEFEKAYQNALRINTDKIKSMSDLSLIAEAYVHAGQFEIAKAYYQKIYNQTNSKRILSKLVHVYIKLGDIERAELYLTRYDELASEDFYRHIYRYNLYRLEGRDISESIPVLEALKEREYIDYWAYELAKLYHKAGDKESCIRECDEIILWFGDGEYVEKAKAMKAYYSNDMHITLAGKDSEILARELRKTMVHIENEEEQIIEKEYIEEEYKQEEYIQEEYIDKMDTAEGEDSKEYVLSEDDLISQISKGIGMAVDEISNGVEIPASFEKMKQEKERKEKNEPIREQELAKEIKVSEEQEKQEVENHSEVFLYPELFIDELLADYKELYAFAAENDVSFEDIIGSFLFAQPLDFEIIHMLYQIYSDKDKMTNILISTNDQQKSGGIILAKRLAKVIYRLGLVQSSRTALIHAEKVNGMNLLQRKNKLMDCCVIIEEAGLLNGNAAKEIIDLHKECKGKTVFLLEDTDEELAKLLTQNPELKGIFPEKIFIPTYQEEQYMHYLYDQFKKQDYELDVKAEQLLHTEVQKMLDKRVEDCFEYMTQFAEGVIKKAEKRNSELLIRMSTELKFDNTQLMVIRQEDIMNI